MAILNSYATNYHKLYESESTIHGIHIYIYIYILDILPTYRLFWLVVWISFLFFHMLGIYDHPNWLIFSEGLKPPARLTLLQPAQVPKLMVYPEISYRLFIDITPIFYPLVISHSYRKSRSLMGKLTISMAIFHSYFSHYQMVNPIKSHYSSIKPQFLYGFPMVFLWNRSSTIGYTWLSPSTSPRRPTTWAPNGTATAADSPGSTPRRFPAVPTAPGRSGPRGGPVATGHGKLGWLGRWRLGDVGYRKCV